jgi:hypothetical protein
MSKIYTNSIESLRAAIVALKTLDTVEIVGKFREFEHGCGAGSYCAIVLDPATGEVDTVNSPSWTCSHDEYFRESGELSRQTLLSSTRAHWSPSPDDGFEWDDSGDDYLWDHSNPSSWIAESDTTNLVAMAEKILRKKLGAALAETILPEAFSGDWDNAKRFLLECGWAEFGISNTPVEGWVPEGFQDQNVEDVDKQIQEIITAIQEEIARLE